MAKTQCSGPRFYPRSGNYIPCATISHGGAGGGSRELREDLGRREGGFSRGSWGSRLDSGRRSGLHVKWVRVPARGQACSLTWLQFSILIRPLFESFNGMVSTASLQSLRQTSLAWLDQYCSLPALRPSMCLPSRVSKPQSRGWGAHPAQTAVQPALSIA